MAATSNVARLVVEEIMGRCTQQSLLFCRRMMAHAGPPTRKRKHDLLEELMDMCEDTAHRQHICEHFLGEYNMAELRMLIARLRCHDCQVNVCKRPRRQDLVAAIISTNAHKEHRSERCATPRCSTDSAGGRPAQNNGLYRGSKEDFSDMDQEATTYPEMSTALVASETSADPGRLRRKLFSKWGKLYAKRQRKLLCKKALADLPIVLEQALRECGADTTVDTLRAVVEARLGVALEGRNRGRFDEALLALTNAPEKQPRARRRFKVAGRRAKRGQN